LTIRAAEVVEEHRTIATDAPRRLLSSFKGVASGRTGVRGGPQLYNQLADDHDRPKSPSLARLAWNARTLTQYVVSVWTPP